MGFLRAFAVFFAWLLAPLVLVIVPGWFSPEFAALARANILGGWFSLVFPHPWLHDLEGARVLGGRAAMAVALAQWLAVATLFALLARREPLGRQLWLAPLAAVAVGVIVAAAILWLPVEVRPRVI